MKKILAFLLLAAVAATLGAAEPETTQAVPTATAMFSVNNLWVMIGGMLVFVMHIGFGTLESGLVRAKNCTNVLFKNTLTPPIGLLTFALVGYSLMYSGAWVSDSFKFLAFDGFGLKNLPNLAGNGAYTVKDGAQFTYWTDFFFQGMFAATCATIVSGAVAGRIKINAYLIFTIVFAGLVYPILGSWGWGGGWLLEKFSFHDFAGSTFVHSIGGWGALAGVMMLGPRIGKYVNGRICPIVGHSMPLAFLGVFLLWFGWFGFNGASVFSADPEMVSYVLVTTTLAASAGVFSAMLASMFTNGGKPDFTMVLNGCLAGLVGITAGADCVSITSSIIIGAIAGAIVVFSVMFFERVKLDDPVGALSVHLVCGVFGTLAVGIFSYVEEYTFIGQLVGVFSVALVAFPAALLTFYILKHTIGIRVSEDEELRGLDSSEHGMDAYSGFQIFSNQ